MSNINIKTIGVLLTATGRYVDFIDQFYTSAERYFFKDIAKHYFLFTDQEYSPPPNVSVIPVRGRGFPGDTLYRYHRFLQIAPLIRARAIEALYYFDIDMRIVASIGREFLPSCDKPLIGVIHPGYYQEKSGGTPERNRASTACIAPEERYPYYICGGVQGGLTEPYLKVAKQIAQQIDSDDRKGVTAVWHDESHWNRYMASNTDCFMLHGPDYCYPEDQYLTGYKPRILALDKDHDFYRSNSEKKRRRFATWGRVRSSIISLLKHLLPYSVYRRIQRLRRKQ